jgi:transketolase
MDLSRNKIEFLENKAKDIRNRILEMIFSAKRGHIGGSFSCVDILTCLYYGGTLRFDHTTQNWDERDRFILSKGHAALTLYIILDDLGFFNKDLLLNYQKDEGNLLTHPNKKVPGIDADTGSLGHGLGIASGIALSAKLDKKNFLTFVLLGDGECYEGSVWESFLFAAHHKLDNLIAIIDKNNFCATDSIKNCIDLESLYEKLSAFKWEVLLVDGHSIKSILTAFDFIHQKRNKPLIIIARTIKGKSVSFMQNSSEWHHRVPNEEEFVLAKEELK